MEGWTGDTWPVPRGANKAPGLRSNTFLSSDTSGSHTKAALTKRPRLRPSVFGVRT